MYRICRKGADSTREDDVAWPKKNIVGRQELEVRIDKEHISFEVSLISRSFWGSEADNQTAKIGSLVDVNESQDAEGLRVFYYLVQDLKVRHFTILCGVQS
jgi:protein mago nashi